MLVVADVSLLVEALTKTGPDGDRYRSWLTELANGELVETVRNLTYLEVISALRKLNAKDAISNDLAAHAIDMFLQLPTRRREITQTMARRIWELRFNVTAYDAAYVALVERLMSDDRRSDVVLATLDQRLAATPGLSIRIITPEDH
ncbi:type II toxin-antitoxin system VapC family toxin [Candidatus Poriferisocius sp.]|uniref:type II toxin-antitoxin system VapC family toxin n=1 Tax=Candidatus Poriferisocius sp. TaxID=3101276 RepID=UPI003B5B4CDE